MSFKSEAEKDLFVEMVETAEMQARSTMTTVRYPVIAGSNGLTIFTDKRRLLRLQQLGQQHLPTHPLEMVDWFVLVQPQKTICSSLSDANFMQLTGYGLG